MSTKKTGACRDSVTEAIICEKARAIYADLVQQTAGTSVTEKSFKAICKIKPLLVYHSEKPRAFKPHKIIKEKLQIMWRANPKAWVTRQFLSSG
ncbi:hypothetical protein C0J45_19253 [Silurus meridionalis]|nr:hypothetical protein C0J45_19253 [Silurus meridionalis]